MNYYNIKHFYLYDKHTGLQLNPFEDFIISEDTLVSSSIFNHMKNDIDFFKFVYDSFGRYRKRDWGRYLP